MYYIYINNDNTDMCLNLRPLLHQVMLIFDML